ncbi:RNA polymerase sigma factor [Pedobacter hiemivivus]|uniref:RNA polymerase sigma-70 factor n=1 Tax=Pedobacter hiemivivus TaxID=2530454 RepID=A0A4R0NAB7_9SPHI|nr:RNA polymerase sigma-70 factor [Pedobacter hiemivivus]TCC96547.1 RNA polymerase sigma-70 factor [Pedobacter hiemivivus]
MSASRIYTDQELMALLKAGNEMAYAIIYKRYWAVLYRHARRMLHDEQESEDVTQEVFFSLWNKSSTLHLETSLSAYLYKAVRNRVFDKLDRDKVKARYMSSLGKFIEEGEPQTDYLIRERQLKELIEQEITALPEAMRVVFDLSRNAHLSYQEIANTLNTTEGAVRNHMSRALKLLRSKLGPTIVIMMIFNRW